MKTKNEPIRLQRAKKGSIEAQLPVRMSQDLYTEVEKAAKRAGISMAEWIRRVVEEAL